MKILNLILVCFIFCACSQKEPEPLNLDLKFEQNANILEPYGKEIKLNEAEFLDKLFRVWDSKIDNKESFDWIFKNTDRYFGESKLQRNKDWLEIQKNNSNFEAIKSVSKPAIITQTTSIRLLPSKDKLFLDPKNEAEGYPFDYSQHSILAPWTPILVSHFSKDGAWAFVRTDSFYGFVDINSIKILSKNQANKFRKNKFGIFLKDGVSLFDRNGKFKYYSRIGGIFPYTRQNNNEFRYNNELVVPKSVGSNFLVLNDDNIKKMINEMLGQNYGWGGENELRDCSLFLKDLFASFGLWLPRNSSSQANIGIVYDISHLSNEEKKDFIARKATPFGTLIYMKGHIMLYGGKIDNSLLAVHDSWGIRTKDNKRAMIGKIAITDLEIGKEHSQIDEKSLLLSKIKSINVLVPDINLALQNAYDIQILGNKVIFNDGKSLPYYFSSKDKLENPSIKDMMSLNYKIFSDLNTSRNDAGRYRNRQFFDKIYGRNLNEIKNNLTEVVWLKDFGAKIFKFSSKNGAADAFGNVSNELNEIVKKDPNLLKFIDNPSGTFNYRKIAGTNRLSMHSYGIAIDLNTNQSHYWRWHKEYQNNFPKIIIDTFEKHGFIWGGRWKHFDTMHFEYRPEFKALMDIY